MSIIPTNFSKSIAHIPIYIPISLCPYPYFPAISTDEKKNSRKKKENALSTKKKSKIQGKRKKTHYDYEKK